MRKLLLAVVILGVCVLGSMPPEASAGYPKCGGTYCSNNPGSRCTCPDWPTYWTYCGPNWQQYCPLF